MQIISTSPTRVELRLDAHSDQPDHDPINLGDAIVTITPQTLARVAALCAAVSELNAYRMDDWNYDCVFHEYGEDGDGAEIVGEPIRTGPAWLRVESDGDFGWSAHPKSLDITVSTETLKLAEIEALFAGEPESVVRGPLQRAFDAVRAHHPEVDHVVFTTALTWMYFESATNKAPAFTDAVDVAVLEDAVDAVAATFSLPIAFAVDEAGKVLMPPEPVEPHA